MWCVNLWDVILVLFYFCIYMIVIFIYNLILFYEYVMKVLVDFLGVNM